MGDILKQKYAEDEIKTTNLLKDVPVVNSNGTPYKEKWYEKLDNWLYDHCFIYPFLWRLWHNWLSPTINFYRLKRLCQRICWGFSDADTWSLDNTFYKWLYPRLKRFAKVAKAYPMNYNSFEEWKEELNKRVKQLDQILHVDEFDFDDWSYIPTNELEDIKEKLKNDGSWKMTVNAMAFEKMNNDFNEWFGKNVNQLWW